MSTTREWKLSDYCSEVDYADAGLETVLNEIEASSVVIPGYGRVCGGVLRVDGLYKLAGTHRRSLPQGLHVIGCGRSTGFVFDGAGDCLIATNQPGNAGASDVGISRLGLYKVPGATGRAAIMFLGGGSSYVRDIYTSGWEWAVILDACNHIAIDTCHFNASSVTESTGGIWFVDGPTLNPASVSGSTNANRVRDCLFNVSLGVRHDGGVSNHVHGHWNAPDTAVLVHGGQRLTLTGTCEQPVSHCVRLKTIDNEVGIAHIDLRMPGFYNTGPAPALKIEDAARIYGLDADVNQASGELTIDNGPYSLAGAVRLLINNWSPSQTSRCVKNEAIGGDTVIAQCWSNYGDERKSTGIGTVKPTHPGLHVYSTIGEGHLP